MGYPALGPQGNCTRCLGRMTILQAEVGGGWDFMMLGEAMECPSLEAASHHENYVVCKTTRKPDHWTK